MDGFQKLLLFGHQDNHILKEIIHLLNSYLLARLYQRQDRGVR